MATRKKKQKKYSVSKLLIYFLFANCTLIEMFTCWATMRNLYLAQNFGVPLDFTPLTTLIGIVVAEVFGYAVYAIKSLKENTKGGIIYETALKENSQG
jgi:hypothetical protein